MSSVFKPYLPKDCLSIPNWLIGFCFPGFKYQLLISICWASSRMSLSQTSMTLGLIIMLPEPSTSSMPSEFIKLNGKVKQLRLYLKAYLNSTKTPSQYLIVFFLFAADSFEVSKVEFMIIIDLNSLKFGLDLQFGEDIVDKWFTMLNDSAVVSLKSLLLDAKLLLSIPGLNARFLRQSFAFKFSVSIDLCLS